MTVQPGLFGSDPLAATHELIEVVPEALSLRRLAQRHVVSLQADASRAVWRPAPGRKVGWGVFHHDRIVGLIFLASPVINLGARDNYLGLPIETKGTALRRIADLSVCVGIQPLAWHWNLGKLTAMLAQSDEVAAWHEQAYGDPLSWITTTSLYGRGTQYNRIYRFLGYTKGYGHEHIPDAEYGRMLAWMRANRVTIPSTRFAEATDTAEGLALDIQPESTRGANPRMRRIAAYQRAKGERPNLRHGHLRGVYIAPAAQGSAAEIVLRWYTRWGRPRYDRTRDRNPPYSDGKTKAVA